MSKIRQSTKVRSHIAQLFGRAAELVQDGAFYEYAVLVTPLEDDLLAIAQLYRDRAEAENVFDELKYQWGWTGFTTDDHQRCQITALVYNCGACTRDWRFPAGTPKPQPAARCCCTASHARPGTATKPP